MLTINDKLFNGERNVKGDFGVEIEIEGDVHRILETDTRIPRTWVPVGDGSLRRGIEFISNEPVSKKSLDKHLKTLYNTIEASGLRYTTSDRTGIHLHMNVLDLTPLQLINLLTYYYIFEEVICDLQTENRKGNHFCFRAVDSYSILQQIETALDMNDIHVLSTDHIRYSALNLTSLFRHGSVEFRAIQTSQTFSDVVLPVAEILYLLRELSKEPGLTPDVIVNRFSENWGRDFLDYVFKDRAKLFDNVTDIETKLKTGVRLVQGVAYDHQWSEGFSWGNRNGGRKKIRDYRLVPMPEPITFTNVPVFEEDGNIEVWEDDEDDEEF